MSERDAVTKIYYIVLGPIFPMYLASIGEDTLGGESNREMARKLGPLNASSLVVSFHAEGDAKTFHIIAKFRELIKKKEIRGRLSSLFPPSVPIQQIRGLSGWDRILRRMLAEGPIVASLADEDDPHIIRNFEILEKGGFDRVRRSLSSFRKVCRRCRRYVGKKVGKK